MPKVIDNPTPRQLKLRERQRALLANKRDKVYEYRRKWRLKNPESSKASRKRYVEKNPDAVKLTKRKTLLKGMYGLTLEQFDEMLRSQGYACAICGNGKAGGKGNWHVDHCHATKRIRGILCHHCNTALGLFRDNAVILRSAIRYLKK